MVQALFCKAVGDVMRLGTSAKLFVERVYVTTQDPIWTHIAAMSAAPAESENWNVNDWLAPLPVEGVTETACTVGGAAACPSRMLSPLPAAELTDAAIS